MPGSSRNHATSLVTPRDAKPGVHQVILAPWGPAFPFPFLIKRLCGTNRLAGPNQRPAENDNQGDQAAKNKRQGPSDLTESLRGRPPAAPRRLPFPFFGCSGVGRYPGSGSKRIRAVRSASGRRTRAGSIRGPASGYVWRRRAGLRAAAFPVAAGEGRAARCRRHSLWPISTSRSRPWAAIRKRKCSTRPSSSRQARKRPARKAGPPGRASRS